MKFPEWSAPLVLGVSALAFAAGCQAQESAVERSDPTPVSTIPATPVDCTKIDTNWRLCTVRELQFGYVAVLRTLYNTSNTPPQLRQYLLNEITIPPDYLNQVIYYRWVDDTGRAYVYPSCSGGKRKLEVIVPQMHQDQDPLPAVALGATAHELVHVQNSIRLDIRSGVCPPQENYNDEDEASFDGLLTEAIAKRSGLPGMSIEREIRENGSALPEVVADVFVPAGISWDSRLWHLISNELFYRHLQRMYFSWDSLTPEEQIKARQRDTLWQNFLSREATQRDLSVISTMVQRGLADPQFFSPYVPQGK